MTGLHAPSLHFHLGAWAVTALCTFLAFWINFFEKRGFLPKPISELLGPYAVQRLDYVAHITGIVGFMGVVASAWFGFVDSTGTKGANYADIGLVMEGYDTALSNEVLAFKVIWTFVGLQAFLFAGIIRTYFVTIKKERTVYDQHVVVQVLYAEATLMGFFMMVVIAGAGGIWMYGASVLTGVPILEDFLPGGDLMTPFSIFSALLAMTLIVSTILRERVVDSTSASPQTE
ncbi:MAG: hypothetical protein ACXAC7_20190 [Candidatus Hodarchaeales archaeon]|jgi:hypothetical protein